MRYYIEHPDEAEAIIAHAHEYVAQFRDRRREKDHFTAGLAELFPAHRAALIPGISVSFRIRAVISPV